MNAHPLLRHSRAMLSIIGRRLRGLWRRYRALRPRYQIIIALTLIVVAFLLSSILTGGKKDTDIPQIRTVTLQTVADLGGSQNSASVIGNVRAVSEAVIRAEASGTVKYVSARIGSQVPAGFVIAELENSAQRAAVLQAEGAYDAAVAARASVSPEDSATAARNAYRDAFTTLDTTLENNIDTFFGDPSPSGPQLLINPAGSDPTTLSRTRADIERTMNGFRDSVMNADRKDPEPLLQEAEFIARDIQEFADALADAATRTDSRATSLQLAALATARASISGVLSALTSAQASYRSGSTSSTASVDAGVKSALGNLRFAQSNLEKTIIRAPIGGTVNFLPIRTGEYVGALSHVATVAQNGALEVIVYVSEEERTSLSVGTQVSIEETMSGIITAIAPALDPVTRQIEVRIAAQGNTTELVNGQTVRVTLPGAAPEAVSGPTLLPLSAVKLSSLSRAIFTVTDGVLVAIPVEIGDVRGELLEILTPLESTLRIVTDARGLAEGQRVNTHNE